LSKNDNDFITLVKNPGKVCGRVATLLIASIMTICFSGFLAKNKNKSLPSTTLVGI
jgi:hypothetical protein